MLAQKPTLQFLDFDNALKGSVAGVPSGVISFRDKVYFEVIFQDIWVDGIGAIGWAVAGDFKPSTGDEALSTAKWYFPDGQYTLDRKKTEYGKSPKRYTYDKFYVVGIIADMTTGELSFSLNGYDQGVAFRLTDKSQKYFPVFWGINLSMVVNFGDAPFKYRPPDRSFKKLELNCDVISWIFS